MVTTGERQLVIDIIPNKHIIIFYFFREVSILIFSALGSGCVRWQAERRAAMATVLSYRAAKWAGRGGAAPPCTLVWAGHEPQQFINLFPEWTNNTEVARINKEVAITCHVEWPSLMNKKHGTNS